MTSEAKLFTDHSKCHVRVGYKKLSDFLADFVWLRGGGEGVKTNLLKIVHIQKKLLLFKVAKNILMAWKLFNYCSCPNLVCALEY